MTAPIFPRPMMTPISPALSDSSRTANTMNVAVARLLKKLDVAVDAGDARAGTRLPST